MTNFIYIKKELYKNAIEPLKLCDKENRDKNIINAFVHIGCEVISKENFKKIAKIGDVVLVKYYYVFLPMQVEWTDRRKNEVCLVPVSDVSLDDIDGLDKDFISQCKRIDYDYDYDYNYYI